jgi:hypothetical protein
MISLIINHKQRTPGDKAAANTSLNEKGTFQVSTEKWQKTATLLLIDHYKNMIAKSSQNY